MPVADMPGVFAVQCPNPKCRKFMLVEEQDKGMVVACLLCKEPIQVGEDHAEDGKSNRS